MAASDDVDRRLRAAFETVPAPDGAPADGRRALISGLHRRRGRRRQIAAGAAVLVVVAVGVAAVGLSGTSPPRQSAAPPTTVHREVQVPAAGRPAAGAPCVEVRVSEAAGTCAGTFEVSGTAGFGALSGAAQSVTNAPAAGAPVPAPTAAGATGGQASGVGPPGAGVTTLRVGQSLTVTPPDEPGYRWTAPEPAVPVATGVGTPRAAASPLAPRHATRASGSGPAPSSTFTAVGAGSVEIEATAVPTCGSAGATCGPARTWSLQVRVVPAPRGRS